MKIYIKNIEGLTIPKKATKVDDKGKSVETNAAGYDIVATSEPKIVGIEGKYKNSWKSTDFIEYETNLYIAPSVLDIHTFIFPRSSISKYNLVLANSIGLIDCFSENSKIKTETGDKSINDLKINDIVYSINDKLEIQRDFISAIVNLGEQETLKIETDDGILEITTGTMVYTENGIKRADELKENEKILHF